MRDIRVNLKSFFIYDIDFNTQKRTIKDSGLMYQEIIKNRKL